MRHRIGISHFTLLTLLLVLLTALPVLGQSYWIDITVHGTGTVTTDPSCSDYSSHVGCADAESSGCNPCCDASGIPAWCDTQNTGQVLYGWRDSTSTSTWSGCDYTVGSNCYFYNNNKSYNVTLTCTQQPSHTVTPSAGANGSISPNTPQTVPYNGTTSFLVTPNTGYYASVTGCGVTPPGSGDYYTTGPITSNCTVSATFSPDFVVTPQAGANGSISPATAQLVPLNGTTSFEVTPNSGYYVASVTGCGGSGNTYYTTGPITSNCTVSATFASDFIVTPSAGANGSIIPNTNQLVGSTKRRHSL